MLNSHHKQDFNRIILLRVDPYKYSSPPISPGKTNLCPVTSRLRVSPWPTAVQVMEWNLRCEQHPKAGDKSQCRSPTTWDVAGLQNPACCTGAQEMKIFGGAWHPSLGIQGTWAKRLSDWSGKFVRQEAGWSRLKWWDKEMREPAPSVSCSKDSILGAPCPTGCLAGWGNLSFKSDGNWGKRTAKDECLDYMVESLLTFIHHILIQYQPHTETQ